jgi:hypothetical protein
MKITPICLNSPEDGREISLTIGRVYEVLGIEADYYRLLSDEDTDPYGNDPVLFEPDCFEIIDPEEPEFWQCKFGEDGERCCYPKEWSSVGFFEDYHDGIAEVINRFWKDLEKYYPETWEEQKGDSTAILVRLTRSKYY